MEIQRIVWHWDTLVERLRESAPDLHAPLHRSCRPLEAERHGDGQLVVAIGCWFRADLVTLNKQAVRETLGQALGRMLEDKLRLAVTAWPGGVVEKTEGDVVPAPDLLAGLPQTAIDEAKACESPIQRYFYAQAFRRGLRPRCQFPLDRFRLDFALPERRIAAEVVGWDWDSAGRRAGIPPEREEHLGVASWRVRWFSGKQVLVNVSLCLDQWEAMGPANQGLMTRQFMRQRGQGKRHDRGVGGR